MDEKKEIVMQYIAQGIEKGYGPAISGVSKHQLLLQEKTEGVKIPGRKAGKYFTIETRKVTIPKTQIGGLEEIKKTKAC